jgi:hypothetical protein
MDAVYVLDNQAHGPLVLNGNTTGASVNDVKNWLTAFVR